MENVIKKYPKLSSSANPDKLALTVKGILIALIPLIIGIGQALGIDLAEADLTELIQSFSALVATVVTLYGLGRKLYLKYIKK